MTRTVQPISVPCGPCSICCCNDPVYLQPLLGDYVDSYETRIVGGRLALAQRGDGTCVYLEVVVGCSIYDRRPAACQEFDCENPEYYVGGRDSPRSGDTAANPHDMGTTEEA